jgi:hypothetical protein
MRVPACSRLLAAIVAAALFGATPSPPATGSPAPAQTGGKKTGKNKKPKKPKSKAKSQKQIHAAVKNLLSARKHVAKATAVPAPYRRAVIIEISSAIQKLFQAPKN